MESSSLLLVSIDDVSKCWCLTLRSECSAGDAMGDLTESRVGVHHLA